MWQLGLALCALCLGAAVLRDRCISCVSAVLLANWGVNTAFVHISGAVDPWGFFLGADYVSGLFAVAGVGLICHRFTLGAIVIALSYALECVIHAAYGLSGHGQAASDQYWWATFYVAVGQMMFVVGWGIYEMARRAVRARRGVSPHPSVVLSGLGHMPPQEP